MGRSAVPSLFILVGPLEPKYFDRVLSILERATEPVAWESLAAAVYASCNEAEAYAHMLQGWVVDEIGLSKWKLFEDFSLQLEIGDRQLALLIAELLSKSAKVGRMSLAEVLKEIACELGKVHLDFFSPTKRGVKLRAQARLRPAPETEAREEYSGPEKVYAVQ